jgi:mono/diheme cytochrome c family protein
MKFAIQGYAAAAFVLVAATGAQAADPANGARLAQRWCAECHVVSPTQTRGQADAPTFAMIAASRRIPEIAGFLKDSHPQMPDMSLTRNEIADLIAWMRTLAPSLPDLTPVEPQKDDYKPPSRG